MRSTLSQPVPNGNGGSALAAAFAFEDFQMKRKGAIRGIAPLSGLKNERLTV